MRSFLLLSLVVACAWARYGVPQAPAPVQTAPAYGAPAPQPLYAPQPLVLPYRPFHHRWSSSSSDSRGHRRRRPHRRTTRKPKRYHSTPNYDCKRCKPFTNYPDSNTVFKYATTMDGCAFAYVTCPTTESEGYLIFGYSSFGWAEVLAQGVYLGGTGLYCDRNNQWQGVTYNGTTKLPIYDVKCSRYTISVDSKSVFPEKMLKA
ncbi:hypothetical protein NECAME_01076 [Necator americanus]|uniref:Uncharacterized protein n=1 Tax=Necator americanus TaxID=51031 RepID=W2SJB5_NECAM|nr:hypothetical protein NECAME_01076 [Necator americanus]ETN68966.1 hypothetical protein NECAME_01076 [Necator americanus]